MLHLKFCQQKFLFSEILSENINNSGKINRKPMMEQDLNISGVIKSIISFKQNSYDKCKIKYKTI